MNAIDIKTYTSQLEEQLKSKLEAIALETKDVLQRATKSMVAVKTAIEDLRSFVYKYQFRDKPEQVAFFKEVKPVLLSQYLYYEKLVTLNINEPIGQISIAKAYFLRVLDSQRKYLARHREFYSYCLSGSNDLDDLYFVSRPVTFLSPDVDTRFSTGYDNVLATILADQLVKEYVEDKLKNLAPEGVTSSLAWTAKKAYLIELIYALHGASAFNNGKAEIKQIAKLFEGLFNVNLGNFYRHFSEIAIRKTNRTVFIDLLKERLEKKLDDLTQ